jgi:hypothetical protein
MEQDKKKGRLSRVFGKRDKTPEPHSEPTMSPNNAGPDSGYGTSEANSSADGPHPQSGVGAIIPENERRGGEMVPAEKNSEIANIDSDRNLAMKPSTGEVFDEDTGEVVTVVTTTVR